MSSNPTPYQQVHSRRRANYEEELSRLKSQHPQIYAKLRNPHNQTEPHSCVAESLIHEQLHSSQKSERRDIQHLPHSTSTPQSWKHLDKTDAPLTVSVISTQNTDRPRENVKLEGPLHKEYAMSPWNSFESLSTLYSQLHLETDQQLSERAEFQEHLKMMLACGDRVTGTRHRNSFEENSTDNFIDERCEMRKIGSLSQLLYTLPPGTHFTDHSTLLPRESELPSNHDGSISDDVSLSRVSNNSISTRFSTPVSSPSSHSSVAFWHGQSTRSTPSIKERMEKQIEKNLREKQNRNERSVDSPTTTFSTISGASAASKSSIMSHTSLNPHSPHFLGSTVQSKNMRSRLTPSREEHAV